MRFVKGCRELRRLPENGKMPDSRSYHREQSRCVEKSGENFVVAGKYQGKLENICRESFVCGLQRKHVIELSRNEQIFQTLTRSLILLSDQYSFSQKKYSVFRFLKILKGISELS